MLLWRSDNQGKTVQIPVEFGGAVSRLAKYIGAKVWNVSAKQEERRRRKG